MENLLNFSYFIANTGFVLSIFVLLNKSLEYVYCKLTETEVSYNDYENPNLIICSPFVFVILLYYICSTIWITQKKNKFTKR